MAAQHPRAGRWSRRQFLATTAGVALVGYLLEACGPAAPPAAPATTAPSAAKPTAAPAAAATAAPAAAATRAPAAAATTAPAAATTAPAAAASAPGGQAIISFGEPDTLLMSE